MKGDNGKTYDPGYSIIKNYSIVVAERVLYREDVVVGMNVHQSES